jgi:hypothetical protein
MRGRAGMLQTLHKRRFGMLFSIAAGLMVSLTVAPARAADLDLPTDAKILQALKAKRLTRCPQALTRPGCDGARSHNPLLKGRMATLNQKVSELYQAGKFVEAMRLGNERWRSVRKPALRHDAGDCPDAKIAVRFRKACVRWRCERSARPLAVFTFSNNASRSASLGRSVPAVKARVYKLRLAPRGLFSSQQRDDCSTSGA